MDIELDKLKFAMEAAAVMGIPREEALPAIVEEFKESEGIDLGYLIRNGTGAVRDDEGIKSGKEACSTAGAYAAALLEGDGNYLKPPSEEELHLDDGDFSTDEEMMLNCAGSGVSSNVVLPPEQPSLDTLQVAPLYISFAKLSEYVSIPEVTLSQKLKHAGLLEWANGRWSTTKTGNGYSKVDSESLQKGGQNYYKWDLNKVCALLEHPIG